MSAKVTALLVVHNEHASALRALAAIQNQSRIPDRIVILDSSAQKTPFPIASIEISPKAKLGSMVREGLAGSEPSSDNWFWLVHDDSEPSATALEQLLVATEASESVVQVGPMQLSKIESREISQLGLTLSRWGQLINPIKGQRDQSQHDQLKDVLAVSTSGMLVRTDAYDLVGGLDDRAATLAADIDFSIRFRRHGFRVMVQPRAKVVHASLTMAGNRGRQWLGGSVKTALRKATIHLRLVHDPFFFALLYWLALPATTLYRMFWRLAQKRPGFLWSEFRAGTWGFLTVFSRFASRTKTGKIPTKSLAPLRATWSEVSRHNRQALEAEESAQSLVAFERGEHELLASEQVKSFNKSFGWLFFVILLGLSWHQLPFAAALTGAQAQPVSNDWFDLFARAGASWQPIGQGFFGPSDPFNWVLLGIGSITFWAPNLALVSLLWFARAFAFMSAWRALSLLTPKAWQRNLGALAYALLPALTQSISSGDYPAVIATILSPWLVFAIARSAGLGRSGSARSDSRTWSWIGLSGVVLAAVGAASPVLAILALVALALVALTKIRRLGYLFWVPLPLAAIYLPLVIFQLFSTGELLAILANPALGVSKPESLIDSWFSLSNWATWPLAALAILGVAAILTKRWVVGLAISAFALLTFVWGSFVLSLKFNGFEYNSANAISAVIGLTVIALVVHLAASMKSRLALGSVGLILSLSISPLAWLGLTTLNQTKPSDGSVVPLLLQKQAELGTDLQLLVINQRDEQYEVKWLPISGMHLEDSNLAYRFAANRTASDAAHAELAQVVGDLVSANGLAQSSVLIENKIGYILVPADSKNSALVASLESSELLESAGLTPFGELWRVIGISASDAPETQHSPWSVTKLIQMATLLGFALLAIPARSRTKGPSDSEIFIDQSESELDV